MTRTPHSDDLFDLIHDVVSACLDGSASESQFEMLDRLVHNDPAARRLYVQYLSDSMYLRCIADELDEDAGFDTPGVMQIDDDPIVGFSLPSSKPSDVQTATAPPILYRTAAYLSSGWPAAYLIATVIFAMGAFIGSFIYVSGPTEFADQRQITDSQSLPQNSSRVIGRITGTADCRWEKKGLGIRDRGLEGKEERGEGRGKVQGSRFKVQGGNISKSSNSNPKSLIPNPSLVTNHYPRTTNHLVALGDQFILSAGLMEITYSTGARVILQGPCTFEVDSADGGFLSIGKLTARVEQSAKYGVRSTEKVASESSLTTNHYPLTTTSNPLFTIRTPTAAVTDLGTEFGVEVDANGSTISHVYRGSVRVQGVGDDRQEAGNPQVLRMNESARVEKRPAGNTNQPLIVVARMTTQPPPFVREIPKVKIKAFDLVDVVAGGDGFSGRRNAGIDPTSGRMSDRQPSLDKDLKFIGDGNYHEVLQSPYIDGVFIPEGGTGPVQTDSVGHRCTQFPKTENLTGGFLWAGGSIPSSVDHPRIIRTELGGVDYAAPGRGLLFIHANKAITFDLDAVRRANPDHRIFRFFATAGNTETVSDGNSMDAYADLWVLLDGKVRFQRREINAFTGAFPIAISIGANDRFLTLAATDGGNGIDNDWILFGDPRLELMPIPSDDGQPPRRNPTNAGVEPGE